MGRKALGRLTRTCAKLRRLGRAVFESGTAAKSQHGGDNLQKKIIKNDAAENLG